MEAKIEKTGDIDVVVRHILTLSSHKGKALVKKDKKYNHEGHDVGWYELGNVS